MDKICGHCDKQLGVLEILIAGKYKRCRNCTRLVKEQLQEWKKGFLTACADGILTQSEWASLLEKLHQLHLSQDEAAVFVRKDALSFVERSFAFAKSDGELNEAEEQNIRWLVQELRLTNIAPHLTHEVNYLSNLREVRRGDIPTIQPSIILPADQLCYLEIPSTYRKILKSGYVDISGRLIVTNKKVIFSASSGGGEIPLNKILNVYQHPTEIFLELSRQANNGFYKVDQPELVTAIILSTIRMATRRLISGERDTRHIPQHIKNSVWQRDNGQCVQCHATEYLEFDHIIPHSKGGATSANNLQILCRRCNSVKRDNI